MFPEMELMPVGPDHQIPRKYSFFDEDLGSRRKENAAPAAPDANDTRPESREQEAGAGIMEATKEPAEEADVLAGMEMAALPGLRVQPSASARLEIHGKGRATGRSALQSEAPDRYFTVKRPNHARKLTPERAEIMVRASLPKPVGSSRIISSADLQNHLETLGRKSKESQMRDELTGNNSSRLAT